MQRTPVIRKYSTNVQREKILASYQRCGLTQREFALREGVGLSTLSRWLRGAPKAKPASTAPPFIPVANLLAQTSSPECYRLLLPGGVIIEAPHGFRASEVQELLQVVKAL